MFSLSHSQFAGLSCPKYHEHFEYTHHQVDEILKDITSYIPAEHLDVLIPDVAHHFGRIKLEEFNPADFPLRTPNVVKTIANIPVSPERFNNDETIKQRVVRVYTGRTTFECTVTYYTHQ
jgi:hypothetical protein